MTARIGVKDLFIHELTTDSATETVYGTSERLAKAITVGVTPQTSEGSLYADDRIAEQYNSITSYDISLEVDAIEPEMRAKLLGYEVATDGRVITNANVNAPYFGISFRAERSDGSYEYRQLFKVRFAPTEDSYATKGESVEFQTDSITGRALPLEKNGNFDTYVIGKESNTAITDAWNTTMFTEITAPVIP